MHSFLSTFYREIYRVYQLILKVNVGGLSCIPQQNNAKIDDIYGEATQFSIRFICVMTKFQASYNFFVKSGKSSMSKSKSYSLILPLVFLAVFFSCVCVCTFQNESYQLAE